MLRAARRPQVRTDILEYRQASGGRTPGRAEVVEQVVRSGNTHRYPAAEPNPRASPANSARELHDGGVEVRAGNAPGRPRRVRVSRG